jgi:hypothetical protein
VRGTIIRVPVQHLPKHDTRAVKTLWLWWAGPGELDLDLAWRAYTRRFDCEHTVRLFKQTLGWTAPKLRDAQAADRWTWLLIAAHTQLRLARPLASDLRLPWQRPAPPGRLTPARVRRGFRNIRAKATCPAGAPNPASPALDGHPVPPTAVPHPITTSGKRSNARPHSPPDSGRQLNAKFEGV